MSTATVSEEATYRRLSWRLIPFLMLCYVIAYLDRINIGFAKLQMLNDLDMSEAAYGLGAGIFFVGYILFGIPGNLILQRIGAKRWIASIMVAWGILSASTAFVTSAKQFFVLRFLLGVAEAGFYPAVILYLTAWFPNQRRARVVSLFQSAIPLAGLFGGPLSGWIMDSMAGEQWDLRGWQWLFLIEALPAVLVGIAVLACLDDGVAQARWLSADQKELLIGNITQERSGSDHLSRMRVLTDIRIWGLCVLVAGLVAGLYGISFWMPTLLKGASDLTVTQVGWLSAIPNVFPLAAMFLFARSSDLRRERRWHVASASLLGAAGLALSVMFDHVGLAVVFLSLAAGGIMSALPMQWSFLTAFASSSSAAVAIGLINSVGNIAGFASPAFIGWLKDRTQSLDTGMYLLAACALASAIIALCYPARLVNK